MSRKARSRSGLTIHHRPLPADETTVLDAIPLTTVPRTLFDLAAVVPRHRLRRAVNEAEYLRLRPPPISPIPPPFPSSPPLRAYRTRSELEDRFLEFVRREGLPMPSVNALVELPGRVIEVDCLWRAARLIVELDGRGAHDTAPAFERDRTRDRDLLVAGWRVVRVTWRQLHERPARLSADLRGPLPRASSG